MPTYEYRCAQCQTEYEAKQSVKEAALTECPRCQGPLKRLITGCAFQLLGSGWHQNDYTRRGIR